MDTDPPLQGSMLLRTQIELVSNTTAAGTFYGIDLVLYFLYLHATLVPQPPSHNRRRQSQFMIAYSTVIMICGLYCVLFNAWVMQDAYIKHGSFPGGPFVYENTTFHTQPVIAVGFVCELVVDALTAAIQIWRLWVVWSGTRYARLVVILPSLSLLGSTGQSFKLFPTPMHSISYITLALQARIIVLDITLTDANFIGRQVINLGAAQFVLRGVATILPTILIAGFLIFESQRHRKLTGKNQVSSLYTSIIAMLVESYALDSAWTIVLGVLYSIRHPLAQFFLDTLTYIEIIAYLLVLYRVANGRASESQKVRVSASRRENISSLHWNHPTMQSDITTEIDTNTHSSEIREPDTLKDQSSSV